MTIRTLKFDDVEIRAFGVVVQILGPQTGHAWEAVAMCRSEDTTDTFVYAMKALQNTRKGEEGANGK